MKKYVNRIVFPESPVKDGEGVHSSGQITGLLLLWLQKLFLLQKFLPVLLESCSDPSSKGIKNLQMGLSTTVRSLILWEIGSCLVFVGCQHNQRPPFGTKIKRTLILKKGGGEERKKAAGVSPH